MSRQGRLKIKKAKVHTLIFSKTKLRHIGLLTEHYKRGPLYEEVELSAARNDQEVDMQDSRAYGVIPARNIDNLEPNLHDSPAYAHVQATPSH